MNQQTSPTVENLDGLIRAVRDEGVEKGRRESERIIGEAKEQAVRIVKDAEARAEQLIKEAKDRIQRQDVSTRHALELAARDLVLSVKASLLELMEGLIRQECERQLDAAALKEIIPRIAEAWIAQAGNQEVQLLLSEEDRRQLADTFLAQLKGRLSSGVELKTSPNVRRGFRIGRRDDSMFYDFTDEAVAEALAAIVNPRFAELFASLAAKKPAERNE